jgi:hypothetical protein
MTSQSAVEIINAEVERNGWKLDIWPANRISPQGEARLKVGRACLTVQAREAEDLAEGLLEALDAITGRISASNVIARRLHEHADVHACEDCGLPTNYAIGSYWLASDDLWRQVVGTPTIVLCPACFSERATSKGINVSWRAVTDA